MAAVNGISAVRGLQVMLPVALQRVRAGSPGNSSGPIRQNRVE